MTIQEEFEQFVVELSNFDNDEAVVNSEIKLALKRLKEKPSIFRGNPNGDFFYEDPILTNVLFYFLESKKLRMPTASVRNRPIRNSRILEWAWAGIKAFLNDGNETYKKLEARKPTKTLKIKKDRLHFAVIGDAGYSNTAQHNVLQKIKRKHEEDPFDYLIHLGDIYFAGGKADVLEHFLSPFREAVPDVLALLGNHELYMGGESFCLLIDSLRQPGRYFAIENDTWCIACLDTSLPSTSISRLDGELDAEQLEWLKELIEKSKGKEIILMSHHFIISGWGNISPKLKTQIEPFVSKIFSWYWGHEHSCAAYDKDSILSFFGACVGNGAFSEKKSQPKHQPMPQWFAGGSCSCFGKQTTDWEHGYLELIITPSSIFETYHLESDGFKRELHR